jgi:thiol-disulfide isomerase/thioredoxin
MKVSVLLSHLLVVLFLAPLNGNELKDPANNLLVSGFYNISLTTAKQLAEKQGKQIFVEFYADWCVPCKWMEETTFADRGVQQVLEEDFIAVRVDIDDFDGFALKQHYNIRVLPTLMILDENGRVMDRREESMSADMLLQLLGNKPERPLKAPVNTAPDVAQENAAFDQDRDREPPVPVVSQNQNKSNHATVKTTSYRVQVGVFTDYANTENLVSQLRSHTDEPIVVLNDYINNKTVFKVLVGDFESREMAGKLKNQLWQNYGIDGFVK